MERKMYNKLQSWKTLLIEDLCCFKELGKLEKHTVR